MSAPVEESAAKDIARLLHVTGRAASERCGAAFSNEVMPQLQAMLERSPAALERAVPALLKAAEDPKHGKEALHLLCSSIRNVPKRQLINIVAPFIPDIVTQVKKRYPRLRLPLAILKLAAPKSIKFEGAENWCDATTRVMEALRISFIKHVLPWRTKLQLTSPRPLCDTFFMMSIPIVLFAGDLPQVDTTPFVEFLLCGDDITPQVLRRKHKGVVTVYVYSDAPMELTATSLTALPKLPFSGLRRFLEVPGCGGRVLNDDLVRLVGLPVVLLRSVMLIDAPHCGTVKSWQVASESASNAACGASDWDAMARSVQDPQALYPMLEWFTGLADQVIVSFDARRPVVPEIFKALFTTFPFLDTFKLCTVCPQSVSETQQLRLYGSLMHALSKTCPTSQPPNMHLLTEENVSTDTDDVMALVRYITETLPLTFLDTRVAEHIRVVTVLAVQVEVALRLVKQFPTKLLKSEVRIPQEKVFEAIHAVCDSREVNPDDIPLFDDAFHVNLAKRLQEQGVKEVQLTAAVEQLWAESLKSLPKLLGAVKASSDPMVDRIARTMGQLADVHRHVKELQTEDAALREAARKAVAQPCPTPKLDTSVPPPPLATPVARPPTGRPTPKVEPVTVATGEPKGKKRRSPPPPKNHKDPNRTDTGTRTPPPTPEDRSGPLPPPLSASASLFPLIGASRRRDSFRLFRERSESGRGGSPEAPPRSPPAMPEEAFLPMMLVAAGETLPSADGPFDSLQDIEDAEVVLRGQLTGEAWCVLSQAYEQRALRRKE